MTTLLSIETSGALCSLALHRSGRWFEDTQNVARMHNALVLGMLDELVRTAEMEPRDIDAVAFGAGPGSFTGVRIAAALAQGIAFAAGAVVVPVSSSLALATEVLERRLSGTVPDGIFTVMRSRRDAHYLAGFTPVAGGVAQVLEDVLYQGQTAPDSLPGAGWIAVGDRPAWWADLRNSVTFLEDCSVTAITLGRLALDALARGPGLDASGALPRYLSGDSPWRPARDADR